MNQLNFSSLPADTNTRSRLSFLYKGRYNLLYLAGILAIFSVVYVFVNKTSEKLGSLMMAVLFLAIGYLLILYILDLIVDPKKRKQLDAAFAPFLASNGFMVAKSNNISLAYAPFIYGISSQASTSMAFEGSIGGTLFNVFTYTYYKDTRSGKDSFPFTVFRFSVTKPLPHIVLDSRKNDGIISSIPRYFNDDQRIELEGDFNNYFDLFAPRDYEIETLDILSPDFMQMLIDFHSDFDVEINKTEIYLISKGINYDQQSMAELFKAAEVLIEKFNLKLQVWSMAAMSKNLPELESHIDESAIRFGGKRITTAVFTIPLISLYIVIRLGGTGLNIWMFVILFLGCTAWFTYYRRRKRERS
jgi:hypothetical protein